MKNRTKKNIIIVSVSVALLVAGYIAYQLYEAAVQDAEKRVRAAAAQGIGKGIGSGIGEGIRRAFRST